MVKQHVHTEALPSYVNHNQKTPNLLVNTGQKVSQKDLQTENIPQVYLSRVFPALSRGG